MITWIMIIFGILSGLVSLLYITDKMFHNEPELQVTFGLVIGFFGFCFRQIMNDEEIKEK